MQLLETRSSFSFLIPEIQHFQKMKECRRHIKQAFLVVKNQNRQNRKVESGLSRCWSHTSYQSRSDGGVPTTIRTNRWLSAPDLGNDESNVNLFFAKITWCWWVILATPIITAILEKCQAVSRITGSLHRITSRVIKEIIMQPSLWVQKMQNLWTTCLCMVFFSVRSRWYWGHLLQAVRPLYCKQKDH